VYAKENLKRLALKKIKPTEQELREQRLEFLNLVYNSLKEKKNVQILGFYMMIW
jgi:hypothetical protein